MIMTKRDQTTGQQGKKKTDRVRKIGEREEVIDIELSESQINEMQHENIVLDNEIERIEEKKGEAMKNFASQLKTIELQKSELRRKVNSRHRRETVMVDEYLTTSNEVVRVRRDTGDQLGPPRTATARELQEELFPPAGDRPEEFGNLDAAQQSDAPPEMFAAGDSGTEVS